MKRAATWTPQRCRLAQVPEVQGTDGTASPGSSIVGPREPSTLSVEYLPLSRLRAAPRNPKAHHVPALTDSLGRFGFVAPVIVDDATGRLVAGHGRVEALERAKAAGARPPDRVRVGGDERLVPVVRRVEFADPREAEAPVGASGDGVPRAIDKRAHCR